MLKVYIFVGVLIAGVIAFTVWLVKLLIIPIIKVGDTTAKGRTKFVIDTTDKGCEYYESLIEDWLKKNKYSKYNKKNNGRFLKYRSKGNIYKFGFNYYKSNNTIIIENLLSALGNEHALTYELFALDDNTDMAVGQQGKDEYINFLNSLIEMPKELQDINQVTLKIQ